MVITTRGSASASEAIVNGLRPYMDVKVVGDTTYGKPVGQYGFDFCDKVLYPVAFLVTNARGEADYFDGIPADCAAAGRRRPRARRARRRRRSPRPSTWCGTAAAAAPPPPRPRSRPASASGVREIPRDGWRQTLNAW